jgi:proteasome lid subunit RPN8/RPN11
MHHVLLTSEAVEMICHACVEVYGKESSGFTTGGREVLDGMQLTYVECIHPQQSARRTNRFSFTGYFSRERSVKIFGATGNIIGGFHSHPASDKEDMERTTGLSEKYDIPHCVESIKIFGLAGSWLEIVVPILKRRYRNPMEPGIHHVNGRDFSVRTTPYRGYDFRLAGYWVNSSGDVQEAKMHLTE